MSIDIRIGFWTLWVAYLILQNLIKRVNGASFRRTFGDECGELYLINSNQNLTFNLRNGEQSFRKYEKLDQQLDSTYSLRVKLKFGCKVDVCRQWSPECQRLYNLESMEIQPWNAVNSVKCLCGSAEWCPSVLGCPNEFNDDLGELCGRGYQEKDCGLCTQGYFPMNPGDIISRFDPQFHFESVTLRKDCRLWNGNKSIESSSTDISVDPENFLICNCSESYGTKTLPFSNTTTTATTTTPVLSTAISTSVSSATTATPVSSTIISSSLTATTDNPVVKPEDRILYISVPLTILCLTLLCILVAYKFHTRYVQRLNSRLRLGVEDSESQGYSISLKELDGAADDELNNESTPLTSIKSDCLDECNTNHKPTTESIELQHICNSSQVGSVEIDSANRAGANQNGIPPTSVKLHGANETGGNQNCTSPDSTEIDDANETSANHNCTPLTSTEIDGANETSANRNCTPPTFTEIDGANETGGNHNCTPPNSIDIDGANETGGNQNCTPSNSTDIDGEIETGANGKCPPPPTPAQIDGASEARINPVVTPTPLTSSTATETRELEVNIIPHWELTVIGPLVPGQFSKVDKCEWRPVSGEKLLCVLKAAALRSLDISKTYSKTLEAEQKILQRLGEHPNIVKLYGVVKNPDICILLEYCEHGDLKSYLGNPTNRRSFLDVSCLIEEITAKEDEDEGIGASLLNKLRRALDSFSTLMLIHFCAQVAAGMEFLVLSKILQLDLAARNVLLTKGNIIKLADFGLTKIMSGNYGKVGSADEEYLPPLPWLAPEAKENGKFSIRSTVWAFGVTAWEILALGQDPYPGIQLGNLLEHLNTGYRMSRAPYSNSSIHECLCNCWNISPDARPGYSELKIFFEDQANQMREGMEGILSRIVPVDVEDSVADSPVDSTNGGYISSDSRLLRS